MEDNNVRFCMGKDSQYHSNAIFLSFTSYGKVTSKRIAKKKLFFKGLSSFDKGVQVMLLVIF